MGRSYGNSLNPKQDQCHGCATCAHRAYSQKESHAWFNILLLLSWNSWQFYFGPCVVKSDEAMEHEWEQRRFQVLVCTCRLMPTGTAKGSTRSWPGHLLCTGTSGAVLGTRGIWGGSWAGTWAQMGSDSSSSRRSRCTAVAEVVAVAERSSTGVPMRGSPGRICSQSVFLQHLHKY